MFRQQAANSWTIAQWLSSPQEVHKYKRNKYHIVVSLLVLNYSMSLPGKNDLQLFHTLGKDVLKLHDNTDKGVVAFA